MANIVNHLGPGSTATVLASAARIATPDTVEYRGLGDARGVVVVVNATASAATPVVVVKIQGVDPVSGATWDILTSADITAAGVTVLKVYPGITAAANVAVADVIPSAVRIVATHTDADSITYSVSAQFIK